MRDARNIKDQPVKVLGNPGKIESFWVTDDNIIYAKVKHGSITTNYKLTELNQNFELVKKKTLHDDETTIIS